MTDLRQREGDQPLPAPNNHPAIADLVKRDLDLRRTLGVSRYGTPLQPHNGRDALRDLYEELLDAACYVRQAMYERDVRDDDREMAWHTLRRYIERRPFWADEPTECYDFDHAPECSTLPPGAVCWADHEPHRDWWPRELDVKFRIRPVELDGGGNEDGPFDPVLTMEIQRWDDSAQAWVDYDDPRPHVGVGSDD